MKRLDAITLEFARQVIEEETGAPLDIKAPSIPIDEKTGAGAVGNTKLIARDEKKNPLISTFEWTQDAAARILRVPAGFMRSKTQERIEELARERAVACRAEASGEGGAAIDLALVEEGIEIGKQMMAEMISTYSAPAASPGVAPAAPKPAAPAPTNGSGYLNEVSARPAPAERREV
jgi:hypothetical protein